MKKFVTLLFVVGLATCAFAQGPGAPPAPAAIPIDGGIIAFLIAAGLAGIGLIRRKKVK